MPSIKITYFPAKGRAEPSRLALVVGGIEFEDERITGEEIAARKKKGDFPFGSLPVMTVDGKTFAQSNAMLRYCGSLAGLYPKDAEKALLVDSVVDALEDVALSVFADSSEKGRKAFVEEKVPKFLKPIDKMLADSDGTFLLGSEMTIADIKLSVMVEGLSSGYWDHVPTTLFDEYKHVLAVVKAVGANAKIAKWNAEQN